MNALLGEGAQISAYIYICRVYMNMNDDELGQRYMTFSTCIIMQWKRWILMAVDVGDKVQALWEHSDNS